LDIKRDVDRICDINIELFSALKANYQSQATCLNTGDFKQYEELCSEERRIWDSITEVNEKLKIYFSTLTEKLKYVLKAPRTYNPKYRINQIDPQTIGVGADALLLFSMVFSLAIWPDKSLPQWVNAVPIVLAVNALIARAAVSVQFIKDFQEQAY
jgi:hypothetical protein